MFPVILRLVRLFSSLRKRFVSLLIPTVVLVVLIHEVFTTPVYSDRELSAMRERAVALSAQGQFDAALEQLQALAAVAPKNQLVWGDYVVVLARAGRAPEALQLVLNSPQRPFPDYALAELFAVALKLPDLAAAEALLRRGIEQGAQSAEVIAARQQALTDARRGPVPEVIAAVDTEVMAVAPVSPDPVRPPGKSAPLRTPVQTKFQRHQPVGRKHADLTAASTQSAAATGAKAPAAEVVLTPPERARQALREAEQAPAAERLAAALYALALLDEAQVAVDVQGQSVAERRNAGLDRVRALTLAGRLDDAAVLFESIDSAETPLYGLLNGADLYSRRHQPARAAVLLERARQISPDSREVVQARFYNRLDNEDYAGAHEELSRLRVLSDTQQTKQGSEVLEAMFAAYENRLALAQHQLEALHRDNPANVDVTLRLAQIYRWRGWPQRALVVYQSVQQQDPLAAGLGEVDSLFDLKRFRDARIALDALAQAAPAHPDVVRAVRDDTLRRRGEYSAQVLAGQSSGSPITGNGDLAIEQRVYLPAIADQFRLFGHQRSDWADFPEGAGKAHRLGVGGDYRSQAVDAAVEIAERLPDSRWSTAFNGEWRLDDYWAVFGDVQSDSTLVPLRALNAGINGHSMLLGGRYRADEGREVKVTYSRTDFSDGNQRDAIAARYRQALFDSAHHQLAAIVQAYRGFNSADSNVPYFNPAGETSVGAALEYSGILARRYEQSWSHRLVLGVGQYEQQHYGRGGIWDAEYEQRWNLSPELYLNLGALYRSRIYDGGREGYSALFGGVNWRF